MKKLLTVLLLFITSVIAYSQTNKSEEEYLIEQLKSKPLNAFGGFSLTNAVPQGEFQDNLKKSGFGFSVYGGYIFNPVPLGVGMEGNILFFGGDTRRFKYTRSGGWTMGEDTITTQSMVIPLNAFIRLQPNLLNFVFPYVEGFVGVNLLSLSADYKPYWGPKDSKDKFSAAFHYGVGAGLMVKLVDFIELPNTNWQLLLDIKAKYIMGNATDFATAKIMDNMDVEFKEFRSKTDLFLLSVGVAFRF